MSFKPLLINTPYLTTFEIFLEVKSTNLFKDEYIFQNLLDWMHKKDML